MGSLRNHAYVFRASRNAWAQALGLTTLAASAVAWFLIDANPAGEVAARAGVTVSRPAARPLLADPRAVEALLPTRATAVTDNAASTAAPPSPQALAAAQLLRQLEVMPPGEAGLALAQQLEGAIEPANVLAYMQALFNGQGPEVERTAIRALAQAGDASVMQALALAYGRLPAENRGRILQVLETAGNPAALDGLQTIVAQDVSERRSPLVASAMVGMAHIGTQQSVEHLMAQASGPNSAYALNALQRVNSRQAVALLRSAAEGGKGYESLPANLQATFGRVADVAEAGLPN